MRTRSLASVLAATVAFTSPACNDSSPIVPSPTPPPAACTYQLTSTTTSFGAAGGTVSLTVTTASQCAWTAQVDASWIAIQSGASGTGPGTIGLAISVNADTAAREALVSVANQTVRLTQQGRAPAPCEYTVTPESQRWGPEGGTGPIAITAQAHCAWTIAADQTWIAFDRSSGTGSATVMYTVAPWPGSAERSATITVGGRTIAVRQDRSQTTCTYSVDRAEFVLHWHGPGGDIRVTTDGDCGWTIATGADWLRLSGDAARSGSGTVTFTVPDYTADATRRAAIELRWPAATQGQNVWVTQEGCRYGAYATPATYPAAGGRGMINVLTQPISSSCNLGCSWTGQSDAGWIRITSGNPGAGDDAFFIEVSANPGPQRTGTVRVADRVVTVTQGGS